MLKDRVQSGVVIGAALLAAAIWMPLGGALVVMLIVAGIAQWEFYKFLDASGIPHFTYVGILGGSALITATWLSLRSPHGTPSDSDWLVLFFVVMAVFLRQFPQKTNPRPLTTISGTLLGVMYVPFLFNFFTKLLMAWGDTTGRCLVIYLVAVAKFTDIGAYFVGSAIGKHKLIPRISPAKTWEGCFGGILTGLAGSVVFYLIVRRFLTGITMTWADVFVLGILLSITGIVGDLTESLFKRAAGIKDSGHIIHGMGGVLDVLDSLLFAAPALYAYARFFME